MLRAMLLALVFVIPGAMAKDDDGRYVSRRTTACGDYVEWYQRRDRPSWQWAGIIGWIGGYLTAYNRLEQNGKTDIGEGMSSDAIWLWVNDYCAEHPGDNIAHALHALTLRFEVL